MEKWRATVSTAEAFQVLHKYSEARMMATGIKFCVRFYIKIIRPDCVLQYHIRLMRYEEGLVYFAMCSPDDNV